jgi:hypothetical protein
LINERKYDILQLLFENFNFSNSVDITGGLPENIQKFYAYTGIKYYEKYHDLPNIRILIMEKFGYGRSIIDKLNPEFRILPLVKDKNPDLDINRINQFDLANNTIALAENTKKRGTYYFVNIDGDLDTNGITTQDLIKGFNQYSAYFIEAYYKQRFNTDFDTFTIENGKIVVYDDYDNSGEYLYGMFIDINLKPLILDNIDKLKFNGALKNNDNLLASVYANTFIKKFAYGYITHVDFQSRVLEARTRTNGIIFINDDFQPTLEVNLELTNDLNYKNIYQNTINYINSNK